MTGTQPPQQNPAEARQLLRDTARALMDDLKRGGEIGDAVVRARELRDAREFDLLEIFTDQLRRQGNRDPAVRRLQAQGLIEQGKLIQAIDVLEPSANLPLISPEWSEARGLMGRAWKQIFIETPDTEGEPARNALVNAIEQYRIPYAAAPHQNVWHGVNLLALSYCAQSKGIVVDDPIDITRLSESIIETLRLTPDDKRDQWYYASLAEAHLALDQLDAVEENLRLYVTDPKTNAFAVAGTVRQFTELWQMEARTDREWGLVQILRAAALEKKLGHITLMPEQVRQVLAFTPPDAQLQAVLGNDGPKSFRWMQSFLDRSKSVGVISQGTVARIGTGFIVRGGDFNNAWGDEPMVLTNAHVVSNEPKDRGLPPDEAQITFESLDPNKALAFREIVWNSGTRELDATLLRLQEPTGSFTPLACGKRLPILDGKQRVNVIGYPKGGELSFSFQDNLLLDHEGPDEGKPPNPAVCRVHYRAPTEKGSSGGPVLSEGNLQVIALHHAGGDVQRLNGRTDMWPANEGIWITSIRNAAERSGA
jgi:V8-like Glu-specific endopeptidase